MASDDPFDDALVDAVWSASHVVARPWFEDRLMATLADPACRMVLVTGDTGAGKSVRLARAHAVRVFGAGSDRSRVLYAGAAWPAGRRLRALDNGDYDKPRRRPCCCERRSATKDWSAPASSGQFEVSAARSLTAEIEILRG